ncbi:hypothetical protein DN549_32365 [Burkholderia multivorans]|nr:hypothetical protein DN549_32365 [Burkholderia multivorans]
MVVPISSMPCRMVMALATKTTMRPALRRMPEMMRTPSSRSPSILVEAWAIIMVRMIERMMAVMGFTAVLWMVTAAS